MAGSHTWEPADMRARLSGLERRVNQAHSDKARLAPDCLRELENAVEQLEAARDHLRSRDAELREMRARLNDWQQRFHAIVGLLDDAYLLTDLGGVIVETNAAAARLLNMSQRFLVGRPLHLFLAGQRVEFLNSLRELTTSLEPTELDFRLRPRERQWMQTSARVGPVCDSAGQPVALQWIVVPTFVPSMTLASPAEPVVAPPD